MKRLVLVLKSVDTQETLERWEFNVEYEKEEEEEKENNGKGDNAGRETLSSM